jgi:hypothetical protein
MNSEVLNNIEYLKYQINMWYIIHFETITYDDIGLFLLCNLFNYLSSCVISYEILMFCYYSVIICFQTQYIKFSSYGILNVAYDSDMIKIY